MRGTVYKACWCRDPETRKYLRGDCPDRKKKGHGGWYARYDVPPREGRKRRQPVIGPFATMAEAEAELSAALAKTAAGMDAPDRSVLTGRYLDAYLAGKIDLKPSTMASDAEAVRLYWKPGIGHLRLVDVRDHHIADVIAAMRQVNRPAEGAPSETLARLLEVRCAPDGHRSRRQSTVPLSAARIRRITAPLSAALNVAVVSGRIPRNPLVSVTKPKPGKVRPLPWTAERAEAFAAAYTARLRLEGLSAGSWTEKKVRIWASPLLRPNPVMVWLAADGGKFLDFIAGERFYALFHLAALSGMRRGEIAALTWPEVRLGDGVLRVNDAKTPTGIRDIVLDAGTTDVLKAWKKQQAAWQLAWGGDWAGKGLVFTREDGSPVPPQWMSGRFETLAFLAGLPPVRFHDLRHFAASLGLAAGSDMRVVAEQLGHSRSDFTRDYYAVVAPEQARASAEAAAALIPRSLRAGS